MEKDKRKMSLFAQSKLAKKKETHQEEMSTYGSSEETGGLVNPSLFGDTSLLISGKDKDVIHEENIETLSKMSTEQILQERQKLIQELDPGLVEFLKFKKQKNIEPITNLSMEIETESPNECEGTVIPEVVTEIVDKWPHMDVIEDEKLKWMEDAKPLNKTNEEYNARFDFEGNLLEYMEDNSKIEGLYHHGEEPHRPGYTIQELLHLSRSSILQQRITSLNTLANILHKCDAYSVYLNEPIKPQLINNNIYLMLRFSLDDNSHPIISPTLHAMKELIVNYSDEICLDRCVTMYKMQQPNFSVDMADLKKEEKEIKDEDYVRIDLIRGSIRTDLVKRLSYVLNYLNPDSVQIRNIIQILIRMARHSNEICSFIMQDKNLFLAIQKLIKNRVDIYTVDLVKLYRILFTQNIRIAISLLEYFDITNQVLSFISESQSNIKLIIESFHYLSTLFEYKLKLNLFSEFSSVLVKLVDLHFHLTSVDSSELDAEHCSALLNLITIATKQTKSQSVLFVPLIKNCATKWFAQCVTQDMNFTFCSMLSNALSFLMFANCFDIPMRKCILGNNFKNHLLNLCKYSWLLNGYCEKGPDCLPQLGSVPMLLHKCSIFPLLKNLFDYLKQNKNEALVFFNNCDGLMEYLKKIVAAKSSSQLNCHYYANYEINMLMSLLQLYSHCEYSIHDELMHCLSLVLMSYIQNQDSHFVSNLMNEFIFEPKYIERGVNNLNEQIKQVSLNETNVANNILLNAVKGLLQIKQFYLNVFKIKDESNLKRTSLTMADNGVESVLPCDWYYIPILKLYNSEVDNKPSSSISSPEDVTLALQWILILETLFPDIMSRSTITARYCRLSYTFLADNDMFRDVTDLLHAILLCLLKEYQKLDFNKPIEGLSSFYDFFRELLEQFAAVSYGDRVFGEFILVPLQQKHNPKYKQLFWSEQAAVLRFLSTPLSNLGVPLSSFLNPCETDPSLLNTYLFCLATGKIRETWCPVLYRVALHHVSTFLQTYPETSTAIEIKNKVNKLGNQNLKEEIINYNFAIHE